MMSRLYSFSHDKVESFRMLFEKKGNQSKKDFKKSKNILSTAI